MLLLPAFLTLLLAAPAAQDTSLFPPRDTVLRIYTNCDEPRMPGALEETLVPKTRDELETGVVRRRALEARWRAYFSAAAGDSIEPTPFEQWLWPLGVRGRLLDNFANPRADGPHEALDIFVEREGAAVLSPVNGIVVASGDFWRGGWSRARGELFYEGSGLSRRAGNGVLIFDPASGGYVYLVHLRDTVLVRTGDLVRRGQRVGRVGHTGNAAGPGRGRHLHLAFKREGFDCAVDGVLVPENPYRWLRAARSRRGGTR